MTFKELLDSLTFGEIAPYIAKMYPEHATQLEYYKQHFNLLRSLTPKREENANSQICTISYSREGKHKYLDAFPMEGDTWEHSLTKEVIIEKDVQAPLAQIAACCLWHTSYYGFDKADLERKKNSHKAFISAN